MTRPLVSIILPVFNAAKTLAATLESVLTQTVTDIEIIAIDDGSSDDSLKVLLAFAERDSRLHVIAQNNRGVSATRNFGVSMAHAEILAFLDADDVWRDDKIAQHVALHATHPEASISYARIAFVSPGTSSANDVTTKSSIVPGPLSLQAILEENPVCTMSNLVALKSVFEQLGGFDESMSFSEDQEWLARAVSSGCVVLGIDEVLVDYLLSLDGLSVNLDRMYDGWRKIATQHGHSADLNRAEAVYCRYLSRRALRAGAPAKSALQFAMRGLELNASAFLSDRRRGSLTLVSAVFAGCMPTRARQFLFS